MPRRRISTFSAFAAYQEALAHWLDGTATEEGALYRAGVHLCEEVRGAGLFPEHILTELQALGLKPHQGMEAPAGELRFLEKRYRQAVTLLAQSCLDEPPLLRIVRGQDGREWIVLLVREGTRWDPEIEMRRKNWLSCVAGPDRRYISPVPDDWEDCSEAELRSRIMHAKPDLRGPS